MLPTDTSSPEYLAARNAAMSRVDLRALDAGDPTSPCGHDYGLRVSTRLTTDYRTTWRPQSMDIKPAEVMSCLRDAGVENWCLMGLHGYVGYLPMPRATQDVDIMVPHNQKRKAVKAINERWPELELDTRVSPAFEDGFPIANGVSGCEAPSGNSNRVKGILPLEFEPVVRFYDPGELDIDGNRVPVIDLMLPWGKFQETILKEHVLTDRKTASRYPTAEAAIVAKYAALISPSRKAGKRKYDAGDLEGLIVSTHRNLDLAAIQSLAGQVWEGGSEEILRFIDCALNEKPFPV